MPAKKGSKKLNQKQNFLGVFQNKKKVISEMERKIEVQNEQIMSLEAISKANLIKINKLDKEIDNERNKVAYKRKKIRMYVSRNVVESNRSNSSNCFVISSMKAKKRNANPTSESLNQKAKVTRFNETMEASKLIHGATDSNPEPAVAGMLNTLTSKVKSKDLSEKILLSKPSLVKELNSTIMNKWSKDKYNSDENKLRSLNVYYSHNVMGKRKYINLRKANKASSSRKSRIPNYIPYNELSTLVNSIDIGTVKDVNDLSPENSDSKFEGCYRDPVEYVLRLAKFYLAVDKHRKDKLLFFPTLPKKDKSSLLFVLSFGGDGAPGSGTSFLISFLNCGKRVVSSSENYLLFGANVDESSPLVEAYVRKLVMDLLYLEDNVFVIDGLKVEFCVGELPNDMKMLAFLGGELSNAATYFSTFANVSQTDRNNFKKSFGLNEKNEWRPWDYEKRLSDEVKVSQMKFKDPKLSRNKVTSYISKTLRSRQEFKPLVGKYIDFAKAEPLHMKNNVIKEQFMKIFKISLAKSDLKGAKKYSDIPCQSLFTKFVRFIHDEMGCNFLSKKIIRWFNDNTGKIEKDFGFRFRGKESFKFLQCFPEMIVMVLESDLIDDQLKLRLVQINFQSILIRKILSIFVRIIGVGESDVCEMTENAKLLFKLSCLCDQSISPSLWTFCNAAPVHTKICLSKYNMGLGCNSMEGREQKHQMISRYAENTTFQNRWPLIFRHEFIQLIHLRENGFDKVNYITRSKPYVPDTSDDKCLQCCMKFSCNKICKLCDSVFQTQIRKMLGI